MATTKTTKEVEDYLIPELNIRVSMSWLNLITFCQGSLPYGDISVKIVNGQPTELLDKKEKIRFDRSV